MGERQERHDEPPILHLSTLWKLSSLLNFNMFYALFSNYHCARELIKVNTDKQE